MNKRLYSADDDAVITAHYRTRGARFVAALLNRRTCSVYQRANLLGLATKRASVPEADLIAAIEKYHPLGWSDSEIGAAVQKNGVQVDRHRVGDLRRALGLATNVASLHRRQLVSARTVEQCRRAGVDSLSKLKSQVFDRWKTAKGWPAELTVRAVQVIDLLYRLGPMTRKQICAAIGDTSRKRTAPTSNAPGGTVLAELARAELICLLPKVIQVGPSRGRRVNLYFVSPGVHPSRE